MEAAKKEAYFNNTIFVFVGDHGLRGNPGTRFPAVYSRQGIHAEHVPLLFYAPGILQPARVHDVCSQLDILPTLGGLLKRNHVNTTLGRDLFDSSKRREPMAFIADPDLHTIALAGNEYYYGRNLRTGEKEFVSMTNDRPVQATKETDSIRQRMAFLTEAWYETSRYLLLNNRKKN